MISLRVEFKEQNQQRKRDKKTHNRLKYREPAVTRKEVGGGMGAMG